MEPKVLKWEICIWILAYKCISCL